MNDSPYLDPDSCSLYGLDRGTHPSNVPLDAHSAFLHPVTNAISEDLFLEGVDDLPYDEGTAAMHAANVEWQDFNTETEPTVPTQETNDSDMFGHESCVNRKPTGHKNKYNHITTSDYAAQLLNVPGVSPLGKYVRLYKIHSGVRYANAYTRVRSKLTQLLAQKLESNNRSKVMEAVHELNCRRKEDVFTQEESRLIKRRMKPLIIGLNIDDRNVQRYGLQFFPKDRLPDLLSKNEEIFTDAAYLLLHCFKVANGSSTVRNKKPFSARGKTVADQEQPEMTEIQEEIIEEASLEDLELKKKMLEDHEMRISIAMDYMRYFSCSMGTARNNVCYGLPLYPASKCKFLLSDNCDIKGPALELLRQLANRVSSEKKQKSRKRIEGQGGTR